jgi:RNA polymerase sigma factor (sigma-70 family)
VQRYSNTNECLSVEALILSCVEPVKRMARKYCDNCSEYEDFVSIGMEGVCKEAARALELENPLGYLIVCAKHSMIDELRRRPEHTPVSLDAPLADDSSLCLYDLLPFPSMAALSGACERELVVHEAIERLSPRQQASVLRYYGFPGYGKHTGSEAGRALDVGASTIRTHALDARRKLRSDARLCVVVGVQA